MGRSFGNLKKINRMVYFTISPFEQRAFAGVITKGIPKMMSRFAGQAFKVLPGFVLLYLTYDWANAKNNRNLRKKPGQYDNDV